MFFHQRWSQMPKCLSTDAQHALQGDYPSGDPSSCWITSKWCNMILVFAASHLMFWELPGRVCTTMDFLQPQSLPWENDRSEGLHVSLSLVSPACWCSPVMTNITSATPSWVEKPSLDTYPSLSVRCLFTFLARCVSCCMALWWKGLFPGPVTTTAMWLQMCDCTAVSLLALVCKYSYMPVCELIRVLPPCIYHLL